MVEIYEEWQEIKRALLGFTDKPPKEKQFEHLVYRRISEALKSMGYSGNILYLGESDAYIEDLDALCEAKRGERFLKNKSKVYGPLLQAVGDQIVYKEFKGKRVSSFVPFDESLFDVFKNNEEFDKITEELKRLMVSENITAPNKIPGRWLKLEKQAENNASISHCQIPFQKGLKVQEIISTCLTYLDRKDRVREVITKNFEELVRDFKQNIVYPGQPIEPGQRVLYLQNVLLGIAKVDEKYNRLVCDSLDPLIIYTRSEFVAFQTRWNLPCSKDDFDRVAEDKHLLSFFDDRIQQRNDGEDNTGLDVAEDSFELDKRVDADHSKRNYLTKTAGTGNIERVILPGDFKEVHMTTKRPSDVYIIEQAGYCEFAITRKAFDYTENLPLPMSIQQSLGSGKPQFAKDNPPFVDLPRGKVEQGRGKQKGDDEVERTAIQEEMEENGFGQSVNNTICQYIYSRIKDYNEFKCEDVSWGFFAPASFFVNQTYHEIRTLIEDNGFVQMPSYMYSSGVIKGVQPTWAMLYVKFKRTTLPLNLDLALKKRDRKEVKSFKFEIRRKIDGKFCSVGERELTEQNKGVSINSWIGRDKTKTERILTLAGPIKYSDSDGKLLIKSKQIVPGYLAFITQFTQGNKNWARFSLPHATNGGWALTERNHEKVQAIYSAGVYSADKEWSYASDILYVPDTTLLGYNQWVLDNNILLLFDESSKESSLRISSDIAVLDQLFPWMWDLVKAEAEKREIQEILDDGKLYGSNSRFFQNYIAQNLPLASKNVQDIFKHATDLFITKGFEKRREALRKSIQSHLFCWDGSPWQIRDGILKEYFPSELKDFREEYQIAKAFYAPGLRDYGFLK